MREADYREKPISENQKNIAEVTEISHEKLPPMPEKSAFIFHHTFYPKLRKRDVEISKETQQKL